MLQPKGKWDLDCINYKNHKAGCCWGTITTLEDINEEVEKRGEFKAKIDFCGILETYKGDHYLFFKDMGVETEDNYFVKI